MLLSTRLRQVCVLSASAALIACGGGVTKEDKSPAIGQSEVSDQVTQSPTLTEAPLLETDETARWSHNERFCEADNKPDSAVIPQDPRQRVLPGVEVGRAVMFNQYWEDCHQNIETKRAVTCGEYRSRKAEGKRQATEAPADGLFGGSNIFQQFSRTGWDNLWMVWGLPGRPADFDERLIQRYGLARSSERNPYQLPGENDPINGGSGQLPLGMAQLKDKDGRYTGAVTQTCAACHSAQFGDASDGGGLGGIYGVAPHNVDVAVLTTDVMAANLLLNSQLVPVPLDASARRGSVNAASISGSLFSLADLDSLSINLPIPRFSLINPSTGSTKTMTWYNLSHRMRSFYDSGHSVDNHRMNSVATAALAQVTGQIDIFNEEEKYIESVTEFLHSLRPPKFPRPINEDLAKQGAVLFYAKDLWAGDKLADIPRPKAGNGSCASCHGVYSPRYAQDKAFLADPSFKGISGYLAPLEIIDTDPSRIIGFHPELKYALQSSFVGYPDNLPGWVSPLKKNAVQELADDFPIGGMSKRIQGVCEWYQEEGYNTPTMYGVWLNAPYLHNGSVPTLWHLLRPEQRPSMWATRLVQGDMQERGFDTSLDNYDFDQLGWKFDERQCSTSSGIPFISCQPDDAPLMTEVGALVSFLLNITASIPTSGIGFSGLNQIFAAERNNIEHRKIYNSAMYASGNHGHEFGRALTDAEARAIIEYIKTL